MAIHVVNEARRCLHCKKPMCREGCPINTNIPEVIELFRTGHKEDAGAMLYENNPLSVICSLVCDHDKQCEGHCVLGRKGAPVHFSSIENYISDSYLDHLHLEMQPKTGQRVAIIGSGPAGITISILLAQRGYQVTMFESREKIGGVLRYGIPEFRLPKSILDRYQKQLTQLGIRIRPNTAIGRTLTVDDLQRDGYEAIFIGTGVWKPKAMGIPGESLGQCQLRHRLSGKPGCLRFGRRPRGDWCGQLCDGCRPHCTAERRPPGQRVLPPVPDRRQCPGSGLCQG